MCVIVFPRLARWSTSTRMVLCSWHMLEQRWDKDCTPRWCRYGSTSPVLVWIQGQQQRIEKDKLRLEKRKKNTRKKARRFAANYNGQRWKMLPSQFDHWWNPSGETSGRLSSGLFSQFQSLSLSFSILCCCPQIRKCYCFLPFNGLGSSDPMLIVHHSVCNSHTKADLPRSSPPTLAGLMMLLLPWMNKKKKKKRTIRPHEINCVFGVSRPTLISQPTVSFFFFFFFFFFFCNRALPVASSPRSGQRRTWLIFAKQIEIFQVNAWLATFKARNANLK